MSISKNSVHGETDCLASLQGLKIGDEEVNYLNDPYNSPNKGNTHGRQRAVGAIESFVVQNSSHEISNPPQDYNLYERTNIIASSKYATPKRVESMASVSNATKAPRNPSSPTHSMGSISQHSRSEVASGYDTSGDNVSQSTNAVYENLDYYDQVSPRQAYYHPMSEKSMDNNSSRSLDLSYNSMYGKAQPQVATNSQARIVNTGGALPMSEGPPVYENLQVFKPATPTQYQYFNSQGKLMMPGSQPGPQVAMPTPQRHYQGQHQPMYPQQTQPIYTHSQRGQSMDGHPQPTIDKSNYTLPAASANKVVTIPSNAIYASITPSAQRPKANIATCVENAATSPKYFHSMPTSQNIKNILDSKPQSQMKELDRNKMSGNRMRITEDSNGSDYVCMTGGSASQFCTPLHTPASGIKRPPVLEPASESGGSPLGSPAPSPTPSSVSQLSGGSRGSGGGGGGRGKGLLPYSVTPPRPTGPTEAQRKVEELTRQLEEEMERQDEEGEYFGLLIFKFLIFYDNELCAIYLNIC